MHFDNKLLTWFFIIHTLVTEWFIIANALHQW